MVPRRDLRRTGPLVELWIGVSVQLEDALARAGRPAPAPVRCVALIDTGAAMTAIPASAALALRIQPKGAVLVAGYSGVETRHPTYDIRLFPAAGGSAHAKTFACAVEDPPGDRFQALIGRDVLDQCSLSYDGITGTVEPSIFTP